MNPLGLQVDLYMDKLLYWDRVDEDTQKSNVPNLPFLVEKAKEAFSKLLQPSFLVNETNFNVVIVVTSTP